LIIFRYLTREVLLTLSAVSAVLLVIIMSGRFIKYMAQAAQGLLDPSALLLIMAYRIPGFLQLILPLGLFLGVLLAYGRLYLESEITVLNASGVSQQRIFAYTSAPALLVAVVLAFLSFYLTPYGMRQVETILHEQDALTEFDTLVPGRFQSMKEGGRVTYVEDVSSDREQLQGVFVTETQVGAKAKAVDSKQISVLIAKSGQQVLHSDGSRYLVLEDGYRYDGQPGQADYRVAKYDTYAVLLPKPSVGLTVSDREAMSTTELIAGTHQRFKTEMHWRIAIPLLAFVVTLIAVPLAKVNPRQGRFLKLLPAIFLYMAYLALLIAMRDALDKGRVSNAVGMWPVHALFLCVGVVLLYWERLRYRLSKWRSVTAKDVAHA